MVEDIAHLVPEHISLALAASLGNHFEPTATFLEKSLASAPHTFCSSQTAGSADKIIKVGLKLSNLGNYLVNEK